MYRQSDGVRIGQWGSPHGIVNLINNVNLTGTTYGGYAITLELNECMYTYLQGYDVKMSTNVQNPSDDFFLDVYDAKVGFELHSAAKHGILTGITGGSTS